MSNVLFLVMMASFLAYTAVLISGLPVILSKAARALSTGG